MARSKTTFLSFNAGETSPLLDARDDVPKMRSGARTMQNLIAGLYGQAERRPGSRFVAAVKNATDKTRLIEWEFSATTSFVLEFGDLYLRFFSNGGQVESPPSTPYEIVTPYAKEDIFKIQLQQINDVAYLACEGYPVQKLTRLSNTSWTIAEAEFIEPPMLDENITTTTITPSATTGSITLTASTSIFQAGHVGSSWRVGHLRESDLIELNITGNATSSTIKVLGEWNFRTYGRWIADILVERQINGGSWEVVRKISGKEDRNVDLTGDQVGEALYRITTQNHSAPGTAGSTTPRAVLEVVDAYIYGTVKITGYTSGTQVTGTVTTDLEDNAATIYWREGAWSAVRGYPRAVAIFEQRLWFAGSDHQPQTVWGSGGNGDFDNFLYGTNDTDAMAFTLATKKRQTILWLAPQKALLAGTTLAEHAISASGDSSSNITPSNVAVRVQSEHGSTALEARLLGDVVAFVQRNGRKVRELAYRWESEKYQSPDLTLMASHITAGGIVQTAVQQLPYNILWAVTENGKLLSMTYEREQEVVGWTPHETDGEVESVAVVYGERNDEVWITVKRVISGNTTVRYVERIHNFFDTNEDDAKEDAFYVDSGLSYDSEAQANQFTAVSAVNLGTIDGVGYYEVAISTDDPHGFSDGDVVRIQGAGLPYVEPGDYAVDVTGPSAFKVLKIELAGDPGPYTSEPDGTGDYWTFTKAGGGALPSLPGGEVVSTIKSITNLSHLNLKEVQVLADGNVETHTVTAGVITLNNTASKVHVGLPFTSILKPQKIDVDPNAGMIQGETKRIDEVYVRLHDSLGMKVGDGSFTDDIDFREDADEMDESPPLFRGDKKVDFDGGYGYDGDIIIQQDQPLPMTVLAIIAKYEISSH